MPEPAAAKALRKTAPRRYSRAVAVSRASSVDVALAGFGVMIALSSLAFAGYMVADGGGSPRIAGMEYFSVFASPGRPLAAAEKRPLVIALTPSPAPASTPPSTPPIAARAIDLTPTGSISERPAAGRPVSVVAAPIRAIDPPPPASPYKLLDVLNGEALIQTDVGLRHVRAGDLLPDLGRVNSIEKKGDHWVLLTQSGAALEWPPQPASAGETLAPAKKAPPR
jgi:hypothetical protein